MIRFQGKIALQSAAGPMQLDIGFEVQTGSICAIYGPSGAGKTTILRMLAGLTDPQSGSIEVDGKTWFDSDENILLPPRQRSIGFVFQDFALFPHLTVRQNLAYALTGKPDNAWIDELLALMQLESLADAHPTRLSGGQQQRVALARAIARRPRLLLLDEALSALDDEMRGLLQDYILQAHKRYGLTTIIVSHYLPEILRLADKVICLEKGRIQHQGSPSEIFLQDQTSSKFRMLGEIADIRPADIVFIVTILAGNNMVKAIATAEEAATLRIGDKVMLASKAFNPVIIKVGNS